MDRVLAFSSLETYEDQELVSLAQKRGNRDSRPFQLLMARHQNTVWRVCYNFFNNADDAEDLAQEVFLKAYRNLHRFEGRSSFKTWIYRIAINTSQNELRKRSRRPTTSPTTLETASEIIPSGQNVEATVQRNARNELLKQALQQLKPNEFQALMLKDIEGKPYQEIAEEMDISLSAAKMRVQRSRNALKKQFELLNMSNKEGQL